MEVTDYLFADKWISGSDHYSMESSLNEMNGKENTDENQRKITNPIYVKPCGRPP